MRKTKLFIKIICVLILILSTALLSACSASTSDSAEKYIVLIGEDPEITEKLSDIDLLVIDAEYFSQNDIARLRENGIHEIYSYINIGSIENFRSYDTDFEKYTLGAYENWPEEKWIDVSAPEWQACAASRVDSLVQKGVDGFFVDNTDVYYNYPQESIYLFDADTGEALVEQNPDLPRCVASLTKMMTALLVLESGTDLNASITIPASLTPELQSIRANRGHTIGLQAGESVRRIALLYALLLPSANDAASVLASDAAGGDLAAFAARMNARASQLGCTTTHFSCPHGLYDANNYSTARDLAKIALACYANPTYRQVADTVLYQLPATNVHETRTITTTNKLLQPGSAAYRSYAHGMKTGFTTKAGRCFITFAQQDGHTYGLVILGSNSQNIFREASALLDWAYTSPEQHPVQTTTQPEATA